MKLGTFIILCAMLTFIIWGISQCTPSTHDAHPKPNTSKLSRDAMQTGTAAGNGFTDYMNSISVPKK